MLWNFNEALTSSFRPNRIADDPDRFLLHLTSLQHSFHHLKFAEEPPRCLKFALAYAYRYEGSYAPKSYFKFCFEDPVYFIHLMEQNLGNQNRN